MPNLGKATIKVLVERAYTAGLLRALEWAYSQDTLCCHVYGTPTDAVSKAIAHVKATGELPSDGTPGGHDANAHG